MAAEEFCRIDPAVVILHRLCARNPVGIAEATLAVAHDQQAAHVAVIAAFLQFGEIALIPRLVLEEGVDVLDSGDAEAVAGDDGEVEVRHLSRSQGAVERPLGEGDLETVLCHRFKPFGFDCHRRVLRLEAASGEDGRAASSDGGKKIPAVDADHDATSDRLADFDG